MVIENGDRGAPGERRPVGHLQRRVLIIVQDGSADHFRHTPCSRGQPDSPTSIRTSLASSMPLSWGIRKPPSVVTYSALSSPGALPKAQAVLPTIPCSGPANVVRAPDGSRRTRVCSGCVVIYTDPDIPNAKSSHWRRVAAISI